MTYPPSLLLSGHTGFIGKTILNTLSAHCPIVTIGRNQAMVSYDFLNLSNAIPRCDIVVHAAGMAHKPISSQEEKKALMAFNVHGTQLFLNSLELSEALPKQFIFLSSVAVYGLDFGEKIKEDQALAAKDVYGKSKILGEELIKAWCEKHQVICTILRLPLVYGEQAPGNLEKMRKAIQLGRFFNLNHGEARKSMVLVHDLPELILQLDGMSGIFHITDGQDPSFKDLSKKIALELGKPAPKSLPPFCVNCMALILKCLGPIGMKYQAALNKMTKTLTFDDSKIRSMIGFKSKPIIS